MIDVIIAVASNFIVIGIAAGYILERIVYWAIRRTQHQMDILFNDFRAIPRDFECTRVWKYTLNTTRRNESSKAVEKEQREEQVPVLRKGQDALYEKVVDISNDDLRCDVVKTELSPAALLPEFLYHYFNNLHDLVVQIENKKWWSGITRNGKKFYISRIRRSLSPAEVMLIFYFCHFEYSLSKDLKCLVEKYRLFENMSPHVWGTDLAHEKPERWHFYKRSAFSKDFEYPQPLEDGQD